MNSRRYSLVMAVVLVFVGVPACASHPGGETSCRDFLTADFVSQEDMVDETLRQHGIPAKDDADLTVTAQQIRNSCNRAGDRSVTLGEIVAGTPGGSASGSAPSEQQVATPTNPRLYPGESTKQAVKNAEVGDCLHIEEAGDVKAYRTSCGSPESDYRVTERHMQTTDRNLCKHYDSFILNNTYDVILCLTRQ